MFSSRHHYVCIAVGAVFVIIMLNLPLHDHRNDVHLHDHRSDDFSTQTLTMRSYRTTAIAVNGCNIPEYDSIDQNLTFEDSPQPIECGNPQPLVTYVDGDGYLRLNETELRQLPEAQCTFARIQRTSDQDVEYGVEYEFLSPEKLSNEFVKVSCEFVKDKLIFYNTVHAWVPPLPESLQLRVLPVSPVRPSVLIIVMDSMSRLNFIRQLPRTHALLESTYGATIFTRMVKVGPNTYPNMLTMLTGMAAWKNRDVNASAWLEHQEDKCEYFDDLPAIWKNFSAEGYVTMSAEDKPDFSPFNYYAKGFKNPPTDYYMRPFWLAMNQLENLRSDDTRCFGNYPRYEYLFNYTREFVEKMRDKRYFAYTFLTGYSHTTFKEAQVIDEPLHGLLDGLRRSGVLNNTVLLVLGDHGSRFSSIRATLQGRMEDNMPYLAIALPPNLRAAMPYLEDGLRSNNASFVSWYDVYELLADVALGNLGRTSRVRRFGQRGSSLLRPVTPARPCAEAGVPVQHCVCVRELMLSTREPAVRAAAHALVAHVNRLLASQAPPLGLCQPLAVDRVRGAELLLPDGWHLRQENYKELIRVTVQVEPGHGLLEGLVEQDANDRQGHVIGDVARINKLDNTCIFDHILELFCHCDL